MGARKKADWREERRKRAWELAQQGWSYQQIAVALGVSKSAVSVWITKVRAAGVEALAAHPAPGGIPHLAPDLQHQLPAILALGAETFGFTGDVWTARRISLVIWQLFGVRYHRDSASRLLRGSMESSRSGRMLAPSGPAPDSRCVTACGQATGARRCD